MEITDKVLREFKAWMKISHSTEDDILRWYLSTSLSSLRGTCGFFSIEYDVGKELVFERARYAYNETLEFFAGNFLSEIIDLMIRLYDPQADE